MNISSEKTDLKKTYLAIVTMLLAILCVDMYMVVIKFLGNEYTVIQLAVFRNIAGVIPLFLLILFTKEYISVFKDLNSKFIILSFLRGLGFLSMNIFIFISVINLDFATAMVLTFSSPFFIVILSIFFLKDKVGIYRWSAIFIGFFGVVLIVQPTSDIFNIYYDDAMEYYKLEWCKDRLKEIGDLARSLEIRLTFHPGQYNQLGSPKENVVNKTLVDLEWHCKVLDLMECDEQSVVVLHGGGMFESKTNTLARIEETYNNLPERIKRRIVLENCEKCYSVEDLLPICQACNIPLVYDTHHYTCYTILHPDEQQRPIEELIPAVLETWKRRGIKPKFHISEQGSGRVGHHSDFVEVIPKYLLDIPEKYNCDIDIMIEAKKKEQAIEKLHKKYSDELNIEPVD